MARPKGARAPKSNGIGHNGAPLTEEENAALTTHYALKIIADQRKVDAAKVELDNAKSVVNGHFKMIAKDLGFTRKEFEAEVITKLNMTDTEYANAEKRRDRLHRLAGLKEGEQLDLIDAIADTVDDAIAAEANGYRAGRRADDPVMPDTIATMFASDWQRGWIRGQEVNAKAEALAAEILARPAAGTMVEGEDPDAEEGEDELDPEAEARRLKASGWSEPTAGEQVFEAAE